MYGATPEWQPIVLPHDAMITNQRSASESPATAYFPGGVWEYRRRLSADERRSHSSVALEFEGVYRDAVVSVNGSIAAHHANGYTGFTVPIDHLLTAGGDDEILVEVLASHDSRWYSGAGIYRDAWLLLGDAIHFAPSSLRVATPEVDSDGAVVNVSTVATNRSLMTERCGLSIALFDEENHLVAELAVPATLPPNTDLALDHRLFVEDPALWSPERPALHRCYLALKSGDDLLDEVETTFGIRRLSLDPKRGLRINGQPVKLRGACVHHDNGALGAATIERAEHRRVELLRDAGFNALRSAHQPMSRAMLDACDRLGILVMDETFDMWRTPKSVDDYARRFDASWEEDVASMVEKDYNHPCVILYSIGNEIPDTATPSGMLTGRALARRVRELDPTRYVTEAVSGILIAGTEVFSEVYASSEGQSELAGSGVNTQITSLGEMMSAAMATKTVGDKIEEPCAPLDAAGYNYMESRFGIDAVLYPQRIVIDTESHPPEAGRNWQEVMEHANVIGEFTWTGWDYLGEVGIGRVEYGDEPNSLGMLSFMGAFPWLTAWCGDLDITGHRRPLSYLREIVYGLRRKPYVAVRRPEHHGETIVHQSPWAWSDSISSWTWPDQRGSIASIEVYSDALEVELLLNGTSLGRRPAGPTHRYLSVFEVIVEPGNLEAVAWRAGSPAERFSVQSADEVASVRVNVDRDSIDVGTSDLAYAEITLIDALGIVNTADDRVVTVEIDGPGVLQGLGSGRPVTEDRFDRPTCMTFDGRCLAIIRPTGLGSISLIASAEGISEGSATVLVK